MEPMPPMKLMTPLATERCLEGVTSGMRATTGVRQMAMLSMKVIVQATKRGRRAGSGTLSTGIATKGAKKKAIAAIGAPVSMKGKRRPILVRVRSEMDPMAGWMKRAAMLSSVIKKPIMAALRLNLFARNKGTNEL